ncbi:hypothetical protein GE09DRAFT_1253334, partial [Coniochaeta sp. 2T2.1]
DFKPQPPRSPLPVGPARVALGRVTACFSRFFSLRFPLPPRFKMASQATSSEQPAVNDIDPNGDVIMVVGPDKHEMRVSSNSLQLASKVFRAMLGPNWSEGQGLSKQSPPKVTLEEDDAEAMRTIFCVLHFRDDLVPNKLAPEKVIDIAIECDKYDMTSALRYTSAMWLETTSPWTIVEAGFILTAAFLFGNDEKFKICSRKLLLFYPQSYLGLLKEDKIGPFLPFTAVYYLVQERHHLQVGVLDIISKGITDACTKVQIGSGGGAECGWGNDRKQANTKFLSEHNQISIHNMTVHSLITKLKEVTDTFDEKGMQHVVTCRTNYAKRHRLSEEETCGRKVKSIVEPAGLCLFCVRIEGFCDSHKAIREGDSLNG